MVLFELKHKDKKNMF